MLPGMGSGMKYFRTSPAHVTPSIMPNCLIYCTSVSSLCMLTPIFLYVYILHIGISCNTPAFWSDHFVVWYVQYSDYTIHYFLCTIEKLPYNRQFFQIKIEGFHKNIFIHPYPSRIVSVFP